MAQRYGGKYSPGAAGTGASRPETGAGPTRMGARVNFLFVLPFVFAIAAFWREPVGLAFGLAAFATLMLAAWLTREGIRAEDAYHAKKAARRPAIPRKLFASALTGAGLFLAGFSPEGSLVNPIIYAVLGTALHAFAFGPDPMTDKLSEEIDLHQSDRVAKVVDEAGRHLDDMRAAIRPLGLRQLTDRVDRFAETAREMARTVENDPRDLTSARKYLGVYLLGARDAARKFAEIWSRKPDEEARARFEGLLDDLERSFAAKTGRMLLDDRTDLDIEIDVLRERLERDGIRAE
ncbi:5-bromo-4-chloroindolyl phosphate hydrolysis family protein [Ovoidimarina sediminis]|uniref:5-bromo-4-chloroindolyl phosphate hydrolysis family protein n=1 Tax=Ovoidimarina sediminis TaxID=3079856 RepID=UPI0029095ED7|nr:5-bromo-4-chloroindolyl phosphate hydrolysis family protein [Rhodophyticola sp. MJ-SS7]MDU8945170.1 5-bromo-4-chloroindolyl phosphate hydrolysis family protein [Rhodophyticola sp. MJ-SS7]